MRDPVWAYWLTTELTPIKFPVVDEDSGAIGETDVKAENRRAALSRAHEIRKFEIELYWKRATYFWILQAAVFTAIGLTWRSTDGGLPPLVPMALAALGCVTSLGGWLSAKGSKFWQENWEHHIDMLEDEFEGRLHKTAYVGIDGIAWSVSGVNDRLALAFALFWLAIFCAATSAAVPRWFNWVPDWMLSVDIQASCIVTGGVFSAIYLWLRKSRFTGAKGVPFHVEVPTYEGSDWVDPSRLPTVNQLAKKKEPFLIRREPKT